MGERPGNFARSRQQTAPAQEQLFDTHPEVSLDFEIVRQAARQKYTRPFLILDTAIVRDKLRRFRAAMPRVRPHYAVKANPDRRVLKVLAQEGAGFEIASTAELDQLLSLGVNAAEVFFSNPMRSRDADAYAAAKGVRWFVVDSVDELKRMHAVDPDGEPVPAHRHAEHRQRLAAVRQVRRWRGRSARDHRHRRQAGRGPRAA